MNNKNYKLEEALLSASSLIKVDEHKVKRMIELEDAVKITDKYYKEKEDFYQESMVRIAKLFGIISPLELVAEAESDNETMMDILIKIIESRLNYKDSLISKLIKKAESEHGK